MHDFWGSSPAFLSRPVLVSAERSPDNDNEIPDFVLSPVGSGSHGRDVSSPDWRHLSHGMRAGMSLGRILGAPAIVLRVLESSGQSTALLSDRMFWEHTCGTSGEISGISLRIPWAAFCQGSRRKGTQAFCGTCPRRELVLWALSSLRDASLCRNKETHLS